MPWRRRRVGVVAGERDERVEGVRRINLDTADEACGLGRCVDACEGHTGGSSIGIRRDEEPPTARSYPHGFGIALRTFDRHHVATELIRAKGSIDQVGSHWYPVAASGKKVTREFVACLIEE